MIPPALNKDEIAQLSDEDRDTYMGWTFYRALPRSAAVWVASIELAIGLEPASVWFTAVTVWIVVVIFKFILGIVWPTFPVSVIFLFVRFFLALIGFWPLKWSAAGICTVIAIVRGAPTVETLIAMGSLVLADLVITVIFRA